MIFPSNARATIQRAATMSVNIIGILESILICHLGDCALAAKISGCRNCDDLTFPMSPRKQRDGAGREGVPFDPTTRPSRARATCPRSDVRSSLQDDRSRAYVFSICFSNGAAIWNRTIVDRQRATATVTRRAIAIGFREIAFLSVAPGTFLFLFEQAGSTNPLRHTSSINARDKSR